MTPEQFCYWLQGCYEISKAEPLDVEQQKMVFDHLQTVFKKVTGGGHYASHGITIGDPTTATLTC